jgi:phosphatidylinositol alpha-1,6-mannosyltransferase
LNNKRILIVTSEFPPLPGGIGTHAYQLARHLSDKGCEVRVIADQRSQDIKEELEFDKGLAFEVSRIPLKRLRLLMYIKRIWMTFQGFKRVDVVFATGKFALWNVSFCSLFYKTPIIAIIHGTEVNFKRYLLRASINWALKRFGTIVAVSQYTKQLVAHLKREVVVIPNGIVTKDWHVPLANMRALKGSPILTTVGRVSQRKGQLNVIKHLPELLKLYPQLHYHCIGIPTGKEAFMAVAESLHVAEHITFHGMVATDTLQALLSQTDVFVMLSSETATGDVEGFGISILEANALGIPSIGSKYSGIEDAIQHGVSGMLIDPADGKGFKTAITEVLNHKTTYRQGAFAWAKQHEWSSICNQYIALVT